MRRSSLARVALFLLITIVLCLTGASGTGGEKGAKGKKGGIRWEYTVRDGTKDVEKGFFRASDNKLFHAEKQIGTYQENATRTQATMEISMGKLKGKTELRKIGNDPPTYEGVLERPGGQKYQISVVFRKVVAGKKT